MKREQKLTLNVGETIIFPKSVLKSFGIKKLRKEMNKLVFISSPYTHVDKEVEHQRYLEVLKYTAEVMQRGDFAFSPIVHCHELARQHELPGDWEYWGAYCEIMVSRCTSMDVLMLDGWENSKGIKGEIEIANRLNIPINYIAVKSNDVNEEVSI